MKAQNASFTRSTEPSGAVIAMPIGELSNALEKLASLRRSASCVCSRSVTSMPTTRTSSTAPDVSATGTYRSQKFRFGTLWSSSVEVRPAKASSRCGRTAARRSALRISPSGRSKHEAGSMPSEGNPAPAAKRHRIARSTIQTVIPGTASAIWRYRSSWVCRSRSASRRSVTTRETATNPVAEPLPSRTVLIRVSSHCGLPVSVRARNVKSIVSSPLRRRSMAAVSSGTSSA